MKVTFAEILGWLDRAVAWVGLYLAWRWRPRKQRGDVTIHAPAATAVLSTPTPNLVLTTGNDAGMQAALNTMAEVFPYEFPLD